MVRGPVARGRYGAARKRRRERQNAKPHERRPAGLSARITRGRRTGGAGV